MRHSKILIATFVALIIASTSRVRAQRSELDLSGPGWKLWFDQDAKWENDDLFLPQTDVAKLPLNPPTGGWDALQASAKNVSVPGTTEEYLHPGNGPEGDLKGVSWWWRTFRIPMNSGAHIVLQFESQRHRAEIFLDHKLIGYDIIGGTPFEVDLTGLVKPGQEYQLAVRITDPGGNFDWRDSSSFRWGSYSLPMSHGFGGLTGRVKLMASGPVYVDDIYVQNTAAITNVNAIVTVKNTTGKTLSRNLRISVTGKEDFDRYQQALKKARESRGAVRYTQLLTFTAQLKEVELLPGDNRVTFQVPAAGVKTWDPDHPNLYVAEVGVFDNLTRLDNASQTFGFRWFAPEGIGTNAMFRLNGKRIVLRTAISWGFWPINGIYPTLEIGEQQIRVAKQLGLNMLNFHRAIGSPVVLDAADELGLLYYQEPGGYKSADNSFADALMHEKVLRMVKRDRSHPSLVIYSLINERNQRQRLQPRERADLLAAHQLDPSRTLTLSSSWATKIDEPEDIKAHVRPFDGEIRFTGWFDNHHAGGPEVWKQSLYKSPDSFYNRTTNRSEIVFWGEEGAISSPPRLEKIKAALEAAPTKGWDGATYLDWYRRFDEFLTRKNLRKAFPTVDALTTSMGAVSHYHQGRKIETLRINDAADGYAVNGWEAESIENHSGIVDCWRNAKADPAIMAYYNQPLYVAVKTRTQFARIPGEVAVDFYGINEKNLHGAFTLKLSAKNPAGREIFKKEIPAKLTGGDVFGELLAEGINIPIADATGMFRIEASLLDGAGKQVATGHDEVLATDWKNQKLSSSGATWESTPRVREFLGKEKNVNAETYRDDLARLDWVVATRPPAEAEPVEIPAERFDAGLITTFFDDDNFQNKIHQRTDRTVDFFVPDGAVPDPKANVMENYSVRWEGIVIPPVTGSYTFATDGNDGVKLWVDGKLLFDDLYTRNSTINRGRISLEAGKPVALRLDLWHRKGNAQCKLMWSPPEAGAPDATKLIDRVRNDGTTLLILDRADTWMNLITNNTTAKYSGSFTIGTAWLGGLHFVREHPLFKDLPVNIAMDWPYQAVVRNGKTRSGLLLEGDDLVAGAWHCYPMALGTAVGVIPCGKGKIVVSTLDIVSQLNSTDTSAEVARKLLCNFVAYGSQESR